MTGEQAIIRLRRISNSLSKYCDVNDCIRGDCAKCFDALDMAIKALEQEPRVGHWIYDYEYSNWFDVTYKCSCCKRTIIVPYEAKNEVYKDYPYCHCGAKMAESEE